VLRTATPEYRASRWVIGLTFGLFAGALLIDTVHAGAGPAIPPLNFPIPGWAGAATVPVLGVFLSYLIGLRRRAAGTADGAADGATESGGEHPAH